MRSSSCACANALRARHTTRKNKPGFPLRAASNPRPFNKSAQLDQQHLIGKMEPNREQSPAAHADLLLRTTPEQSGAGFRHGQEGGLCGGNGERARRGLCRDEITSNRPAIAWSVRVIREAGAASVLVMGVLVVLPLERRKGIVAPPTGVRMVPAATQERVGRQHRSSEVGKETSQQLTLHPLQSAYSS